MRWDTEKKNTFQDKENFVFKQKYNQFQSANVERQGVASVLLLKCRRSDS